VGIDLFLTKPSKNCNPFFGNKHVDETLEQLTPPRLENSWGEAYTSNGIDAYTIICGGVATRAALLDYHLGEYQDRLEEGMQSADRTFCCGASV
jgi:hypothetical protein